MRESFFHKTCCPGKTVRESYCQGNDCLPLPDSTRRSPRKHVFPTRVGRLHANCGREAWCTLGKTAF